MLIKKYTADWIKNFADLKREIDLGLSGLEYEIEHVGSTSFNNFAAKPIIDIDIIYKKSVSFENVKED